MKLGPEKARRILLDLGTYTVKQLADRENVTRQAIYDIRDGRMYRDVWQQVDAEFEAMTDAELDAMIQERYATMPYTPEDLE